MDGIFGVGIAEVLLIGLVLFVIGGPENTAKWARELGRWVRKGREAWADVMAQLENELGDEGKEIVDAAREVGQEVRELRSMTSPRGMVRSTLESDLKSVIDPPSKPAAKQESAKQTTAETSDPAPVAAAESAGASDDAADSVDAQPARKPGSPYAAWTPPDDASE